MTETSFTKGLHEIARGSFAWLQPDGSWGFSNSGLVTDSDCTLLVDTLYDLKLTREMLDGYAKSIPAAGRIDTLVNTHANGDHTFGNQLVTGARIVASQACAEEMYDRPPGERAGLMRRLDELGEAGTFLREVVAPHFDFEGLVLTPPTDVFVGQMTLHVGAKEVRLLEVGPAHTRGDILVYVPQDRIVYTGDILFNGGHPVIWAGPIANWVRACDLILGWDVEVIVPGHGALADKSNVRAFRRYLLYLEAEVRKCFDAGLSEEEAIEELSFDAFRGWLDSERVVINVHTLYREWSASGAKPDMMKMWARMARYRREHARHETCAPNCNCGSAASMGS